MTTFTGPVHISQLDTDVTSISLSPEGSASFTGELRSGDGRLPVVQSVTVNAQNNTAAASGVDLVPGGHLLEINYNLIDDVFATAASDVNILIGTSADDNQFATLAVSGGAPSRMTLDTSQATGVSGAAMHAVTTANAPVFVKTTAVSGAVSSKDALLSFVYTRG